MATTSETTTYRFPYPLGTDALSNIALRVQELAVRMENTYSTLGFGEALSPPLQPGDTAGGSLTGTYPAPFIKSDAIDNSMIINGTIGTDELADDAVTTIKILNGNVTSDKIQSDVVLSGVPTAPTPDTNDTSTRIATTSYVYTLTNNIIAGTFNPIVQHLDFNAASTSIVQQARLVWNNTDGTLDLGLLGGNVILPIGVTSTILVKHADNSGLIKGKAVYVVGSTGTNNTVRYALADSDPTSSKTFGIMAESVSGGAKAFTVNQGLIKNIDTSWANNEGDAIWLSPSVAGDLTTTKPVAPDHLVLIGWVLRKHATTGSIYVRITNGFELDELHDVRITSIQPNDLLQYDSTIPSWKNVATIAPVKVTGTAITAADTGTVTSTMILNNTILNTDVNASAAIAASKLDLSLYPGHTVVADTASRPASPIIGQMIYQSDTGDYLKYVTFGGASRWMCVVPKTNRNVIINGDFSIAQRSSASVALTTGSSYGSVDRWLAAQGTTAAGSVQQITTGLPTQATNGVTFRTGLRIGRTAAATSTGQISLNTAFETRDCVKLQGKTLTLSFWAKAGANYSSSGLGLGTTLVTGTGSDQAANNLGAWTSYATPLNVTTTLTTSWVLYSQTVTISNATTQIAINFAYNPIGTAGADDNVYITGVQLEICSAPSEFEFQDYADVLRRCQRYYYHVTNKFMGFGMAASTTVCDCNIQMPVPLRINATSISQAAITDMRLTDGVTGFACNTTALSLLQAGTVNNLIRATATGLTQYRTHFLDPANANGFIGFNAEL